MSEDRVPVPDIVQHENGIATELFPRVSDYLTLLASAYELSGQALLCAYPDRMPSLAKLVCSKLLMRLNNDLRAVYMLAEVGYDVQANALAASIYECAFTIATVADDSSLAKEWSEHDDPTVSFRNAYDLTVSGLRKYGAHVNWIAPVYRIYRQLCWLN